MKWLPLLLAQLARADAVLVRVHSSRGSVPREAGAWMAVFADSVLGTVGGGRLELDAIAAARNHLLQLGAAPFTQRYALGPSLGQCCGGEVHLQFERITAQDSEGLQQRLQPPRLPVALFGGGHVGQALVDVLGNLPFAVEWIDSRDGIFPATLPDTVHCEHSEPVQAAVAGLAPQSRVLIMSFSHAEDLDIVAACLTRQRAQGDLPYIGLIGSQTKWATFRHRLEARGFSAAELAHVTCPIGVLGIHDKRPEVIAVAVAAQLLQVQDPEPKAAA
ncbi:xanthine dehydrogenase accessory protein XdhC [Rhodoferax sp. TS-BS-61-7]|uniref:xanthine dehydrogenase accessory protein XdhC n=1 Tax=Rhodoferax sp. TS-BS-61-7 TaxID=2094194 RepID=UPI000CF6D6CB|nr:xanthine dehydrogenase accessory protein XdhC [Rhodoferax sp. TS-BS-61-7]PQA77471.1 xanthine dehydrogenase accessory protein XdhC [Rhodoferax sp. TS-BS-61-7]